MKKILKVFSSGDDQKELAAKYHVIAQYDAFLVVEADEAQTREIAKAYPVEDITTLYEIRLAGRTITPAPGQVIREKGLSKGPHHYLVQFAGPIKQAWLSQIRKAGGQPRSLWSDFTYVVRATDPTIKQIAALPSVRWVGHLPHRDRIASHVLDRVNRTADDNKGDLPRTRVIPGNYKIEFFGPEDAEAAIGAVRKLGFKVLAQKPRASMLVVRAPDGSSKRKAAIIKLSAVHGVKVVREQSLKRPANDVAAGIMGASHSLGNPGLGLSGRGETIAVCDTGLDTGNPNTIHPDFSKRVAWIKSYPITADYSSDVKNPRGNDGPADLDSGHGTHVSGSVLGSGTASKGLIGLKGPIRGLAYEARLLFQAVEQEIKWKDPKNFKRFGRYLLAGIPLDLHDLFRDAYARGARIHSNSWGGGDPGAYDTQCGQLDRFVWEHKDFCVLVAAGNDGTDKDGDGKINPMSVTSPGTAKNCITVGACENLRPNFNTEVYGDWWPDDYPAAPFKNDPMADNPRQVVAFSSRGPTRDGRVKPEIIAPGTFILSTRSTMIAPNNTAWAPFPPSKSYFYMGGTSMATPLTAGAVAIVRQYLRNVRKMHRPSAALLKACLVAGATRISASAPNVILDNDQGFGLVNLDALLSPPSPQSASFADIRPGIRTGELQRRTIHVLSAANSVLRVVLAYSDYPGSTLVNNLNLFVTSPAGRRYCGNATADNPTTVDAANNVEAVHIPNPQPGNWTIDVVGSNVPHGPQDFSLVILGPQQI